MFWAGLWASAGAGFPYEGDRAAQRRWGGGLEGGFRFLALDVGAIRSEADWQLRGRWGIALAHETFSGSNQRFGRHCPEHGGRYTYTEVECDRTVVGLSLFVFHALAYDLETEDWLNAVGVSLKVGMSL
jgi:hypothetical protein